MTEALEPASLPGAREPADEQVLHALAQHAQELVLVFDAGGGLRYANPAVERFFGLPTVELRRRDLRTFLHPADRERAAAGFASDVSAAAPLVFRLTGGDGAWRVVEAVVTRCLDDPVVAGTIVHARDVTEAYRTREALAQSEALLRQAQRISRVGHWRWDVGRDRIDWLSDELYAIHGLTPDTWAATSAAYFQLLPAADRPRLRRAVERCFADGSASIVYRVVRLDGAVRFVRLESEVVPGVPGDSLRIVGTCQDVTEQEELRFALDERVKELTCLVQVSRTASGSNDVDELCAATVAALGPAMQHPDQAVAQVAIDEAAHGNGAVPEGRGGLSAPIVLADRVRGHVRVSYDDDGHGFLAEEAELVEAVAGTLALWLERQESVVALAESEARFRRLFDNAVDVIYRYRVGREHGFEYVSPSIEAVTGYTPAECLADPEMVDSLVHPDDAAMIAAVFTGTGPSQPDPVRVTAKDGSVRWTEHRTVPIRDRAGRLVAVEGVARDVTERIVAVDELEQRAREQATVARLGAVALRADGLGEVFDLAVALVAETLPVNAVTVSELVPGSDELRVVAEAGSRAGVAGHDLEDGATAVIETRDGSVGALRAFVAHRQGLRSEQVDFLRAVANILGAAVERQRADETVERHEREFRMLAEHSLDVIARFDRAHRHVYVNPAVERVTGLPAATFIGKTNEDLGQPPELVKIWDRSLEQVFTSGEPVFYEFDYVGKDGPVALATHVVPEFGPDGTATTALGVTRDITELRRAEQQRRDVLARIVAAQEAERSRIGEEIHDDSVQVMAAVGLRLEALEHQLDDPDALAAVERLAGAVQRAISRLRTLMFALRPPELDRDGLAAALGQYLETTLHDTRPRWELLDRSGRELPTDLRAVAYRIAQEAIVNVRKHARAAMLQVTLDDIDDGLRVQVRDDGVGFHVEELGRARPHHIGTRAMRERAEVAGGRLEIESAPGHGTVATVWLPYAGHGGGIA